MNLKVRLLALLADGPKSLREIRDLLHPQFPHFAAFTVVALLLDGEIRMVIVDGATACELNGGGA